MVAQVADHSCEGAHGHGMQGLVFLVAFVFHELVLDAGTAWLAHVDLKALEVRLFEWEQF